MKDLKAVIKKMPSCLTDKRILQSCLMDSGWDQRTISVLVNLMDGGIVQKIQKNGGILSQTDIYNLISQQERRYGTSRKFVEEGIQLWTEALGTTVPKARPELQSKKKQKNAGSDIKNAAGPAEITLGKHRRSVYEKIVLAIGWLDILLWGVSLLTDFHIFDVEIIMFFSVVVFTLLMMLPVLLMQRHLWKKVFNG